MDGVRSLQGVDAAYEVLKRILPEMSQTLSSTDTESDTRLKIIDRMLIEVLGWTRDEIRTEKRSGEGYADYVCSLTGKARLIVEAKRDGRALGCEAKHAGGHYKLSGATFRNQAADEGIKQAITYCGINNAELACVTNGREWVIFRGSRVGDGMNTLEGMAFVIPGLADLDKKFELFYTLLSKECVKQYTYRPHFQEAEGQPIRTSIFSKALRPQGSARMKTSSTLPADLDRTMGLFFKRLGGEDDEEIVRECFVETPESRLADSRLIKIAESISGQIRPLDTSQGTALTEVIQRTYDSKSREFVLVVGTKGSGKSTFIRRFFTTVLPQRVAEKCTSVTIDLGTNTGDVRSVAAWLDKQLLSGTERTLFPESPSYKELKGMFYDEYRRMSKGPLAALYESDHLQFEIEFGRHIDAIRRDEPHQYIRGLLRHVLNSRNSLPVIILDNADHFDIEFQQAVYQYARSVYELVSCLVIMPITDRTSWQLSKHGALQSFEHVSLFLPTPQTGEVIRKRILFLQSKITDDGRHSESDYFVKKGVSLSVRDLNGFARTLQRIFIDTPNTSSMIGDLANYDVRRTLDLVRKTVSSPHLPVGELISAYVTGQSTSIKRYLMERAVIRQQYESYPTGQNDFVQNLYALDGSLPTSPLLGVRLLQLLRDVPVREHEGSTVDLDQVRAYFLGLGVVSRPVDLWVDVMLKTGLVLNYDPTIQDVDEARVIEISPAGRRHLAWSTGTLEYVSSMAEATPILTESIFQDLRAVRQRDWALRAHKFMDYLLSEDTMYVTLPDHVSYESQKRVQALIKSVQDQAQRIIDIGDSYASGNPRR